MNEKQWMIASDIHGSAYYCKQMVEAFAREGADGLLLLGDLLYHGPRNDLPRDYAPKQVIEMLSALAPYIRCVRGNCDAEVDQMVLPFPIMADYAVIETDGLTVFATHGHHFTPDAPPALPVGSVLLTGHTHIPAAEERAGFWYLNPGSVSIPKEGSVHGYMMLRGRRFTWHSLDGTLVRELTL